MRSPESGAEAARRWGEGVFVFGAVSFRWEDPVLEMNGGNSREPCEGPRCHGAVPVTVVMVARCAACVLTAACVFPVSALCVGSDEWRAVSHLVSAARLGRTPCSRKSSRQSRESGTWSWPDSLLRARDLLGAQAPLRKMRERPHCTAAQSLPAGTPCMSATSPSQDRESEAACWCLPCRCASGLPLVVPAPPRPLCRDVSSRPGAGA